jgi:glycosyltransferase involved in cell wall biosynthesis
MATYMRGLLASDVPRMCRLRVVAADRIGKGRCRGPLRALMNVLNFIALGAAVKFSVVFRRPAIIHIQTSSFAGFYEKACLALIGRFFARKVIMHVHGGRFGEFYRHSGSLGRWFIRGALRMCHRVIAATPSMRDTLLDIGAGPERVSLLPNPVALPPEAPEPAGTPPVALFLGRTDRAKGVIDLIEAFAAVHAAAADARLEIAGPTGDALCDAERAVGRLGLGDCVSIRGPVPEDAKAATYRSAGIYVLPSHVEDMPYGLLEAMSYSLPCVATAVGGVPAMLADGSEGLLVPPRDPAALAGALCRLLADVPLRKRLGKAARARVERDFGWDKGARSLLELYELVQS